MAGPLGAVSVKSVVFKKTSHVAIGPPCPTLRLRASRSDFDPRVRPLKPAGGGWLNLCRLSAPDRWSWFIGTKFAFFRRKTPLLRLELFSLWVESRCGAVALGRTYLLPPLSSGGALVVPPWLRFHIPLIEPARQISRIRLSDKTSRCRVQRHLQLLNSFRS